MVRALGALVSLLPAALALHSHPSLSHALDLSHLASSTDHVEMLDDDLCGNAADSPAASWRGSGAPHAAARRVRSGRNAAAATLQKAALSRQGPTRRPCLSSSGVKCRV